MLIDLPMQDFREIGICCYDIRFYKKQVKLCKEMEVYSVEETSLNILEEEVPDAGRESKNNKVEVQLDKSLFEKGGPIASASCCFIARPRLLPH